MVLFLPKMWAVTKDVANLIFGVLVVFSLFVERNSSNSAEKNEIFKYTLKPTNTSTRFRRKILLQALAVLCVHK